ncbi:PREDICTED: cysteine proteinase inhibitor 1-like [Fragaria vesca subsp. vesca]|uniref:cysteine proteinase inhibitor 1-like n=1 Tax=Fragaria vesca subsp. vesca TaxID=101020 RepID=UPI0002C335F7|nr:PREDICTED: cysteine proteinase inhibitor 1-like [Fragaria vesca subsp. vesca]
MRPNCLLLLLSLFLFAPLKELLAGMGPQRVNINDAHLKEIAEFAVSEFNKESLKSLVFQRVVSGLSQLVEGDLYTLVIAVRDESLPASPIMNYQCRVNERVWLDDPLKLISFHQVFYDTVISMWD